MHAAANVGRIEVYETEDDTSSRAAGEPCIIQNNRSAVARLIAISLLNQQLANAVDVSRDAREAQWNLKRREFSECHALVYEMAAAFDKVAPDDVRTCAELQQLIHDALRRQHPEWVEPNGASPLCDSYDARFAELLGLFTPQEEDRAAA